jgi:hypothetical protein
MDKIFDFLNFTKNTTYDYNSKSFVNIFEDCITANPFGIPCNVNTNGYIESIISFSDYEKLVNMFDDLTIDPKPVLLSDYEKSMKIFDKYKNLFKFNKCDILDKINFIDSETMMNFQYSYFLLMVLMETYQDIIKTKLVFVYDEYEKILMEFDNLKKIKIDFCKNEYKKNLKYIDYALEECDASYLLMTRLVNIDTYNINYNDINNIDNIINKLIKNDIQKHIFCISTQIIIPHEIFKIFEMNCYNVYLTKFGEIAKEIMDEHPMVQTIFLAPDLTKDLADKYETTINPFIQQAVEQITSHVKNILETLENRELDE